MLVAGGLAAGATSVLAGPGDRMVICHKPQDPAVNQTVEVARSAWSGHQQHGDHEGACGKATASQGSRPAAPVTPRPPPPARLSLEAEGDGRLDGDAQFRLELANSAGNPALGVRLTGRLDGEGQWRVQAPRGATCSISGDQLDCRLPDIAGHGKLVVRLWYEGPLRVCEPVHVDLTASASNDQSVGDDRGKAGVHAGACSPLDK